MDLNDLTQEQWDKLRECKTPEDILALAKEEGYSLSDAELEAVSGGGGGWCKGFCEDYLPCLSLK